MEILSTGDPSTLGSYRRLVLATFGKESPALAFIDKKITESQHGAQEEVIAEERQMIQLLINIHLGHTKGE